MSCADDGKREALVNREGSPYSPPMIKKKGQHGGHSDEENGKGKRLERVAAQPNMPTSAENPPEYTASPPTGTHTKSRPGNEQGSSSRQVPVVRNPPKPAYHDVKGWRAEMEDPDGQNRGGCSTEVGRMAAPDFEAETKHPPYLGDKHDRRKQKIEMYKLGGKEPPGLNPEAIDPEDGGFVPDPNGDRNPDPKKWNFIKNSTVQRPVGTWLSYEPETVRQLEKYKTIKLNEKPPWGVNPAELKRVQTLANTRHDLCFNAPVWPEKDLLQWPPLPDAYFWQTLLQMQLKHSSNTKGLHFLHTMVGDIFEVGDYDYYREEVAPAEKAGSQPPKTRLQVGNKEIKNTARGGCSIFISETPAGPMVYKKRNAVLLQKNELFAVFAYVSPTSPVQSLLIISLSMCGTYNGTGFGRFNKKYDEKQWGALQAKFHVRMLRECEIKRRRPPTAVTEKHIPLVVRDEDASERAHYRGFRSTVMLDYHTILNLHHVVCIRWGTPVRWAGCLTDRSIEDLGKLWWHWGPQPPVDWEKGLRSSPA